MFSVCSIERDARSFSASDFKLCGVSEFDLKFVEGDCEAVTALGRAAEELQVKGLVDLCYAKVVK